ncbi:hypothetical protein [Cytobacillus sp. IB215665]|uniref:hypothetical protein n=1 Tax=Cytobacillus sp. IB215665 TaxID=3097357 RepID=UPI002A14A9BD|nr:hypothetical protein [Cytobacillus sp. IB215665]MDX8367156.1 hypothetical protein [Cytobacillus sp. IB215665]
MGKMQFAQKIDPNLNENLSNLIDQYVGDGRIKEKGEIVNLMYDDHLSLENKRNQLSNVENADDLDGHLRRIEELFKQSAISYHSRLDVMQKEHSDQVQHLRMKITELEGVVEVYKKQLTEKTIEIHELNKDREKLRKKISK